VNITYFNLPETAFDVAAPQIKSYDCGPNIAGFYSSKGSFKYQLTQSHKKWRTRTFLRNPPGNEKLNPITGIMLNLHHSDAEVDGFKLLHKYNTDFLWAK